jgi:hypothetical protein
MNDKIYDQDLLYVEIIMIDDAFRTPFLARRFMIKIYCMWMMNMNDKIYCMWKLL